MRWISGASSLSALSSLWVNDRLSASALALLSVIGWLLTKRVGTRAERFIFSKYFRVLHHCLVDLSSSSREDLSFMLNLFCACLYMYWQWFLYLFQSYLIWDFFHLFQSFTFLSRAALHSLSNQVWLSDLLEMVRLGMQRSIASVIYVSICAIHTKEFGPFSCWHLFTKEIPVSILTQPDSLLGSFWSMYCEMVEGYIDCGMVWSTNSLAVTFSGRSVKTRSNRFLLSWVDHWTTWLKLLVTHGGHL